MSFPQPDQAAVFLNLAVFRLLDTCITLQEGMEGFYHTAALESVPGILSVFRWFNKRGVKVVLLSELSPEDTKIILSRLDWPIGDKQTDLIHRIHYAESGNTANNPINQIVTSHELPNALHIVTVGDTCAFLKNAALAGVRLNIGITYGSANYRVLRDQPHQQLLDNILALPDYLVSSVIVQEPLSYVSSTPLIHNSRLKQLRLRLPFF